MSFKGKVVLITGSSKGIGKATALLFAKEGAKIIINYCHSEKEAKQSLKEVSKLSETILVKCDVSNEEQVEKMFKKIIAKFKKLDILVNCAGTYIDGDEWNGTPKIWENTLKLNLISAMNTSKYAAEIFQKQKSGIIVNVASKHSLAGKFDALAYAASKAGIVSITQAYAKLLSPFGRANAVSPGAVNSGYWLRAPKEELAEQIAANPLKRLIEPNEIAKEILFLASDKSKITGKNILLDNNKRKVF